MEIFSSFHNDSLFNSSHGSPDSKSFWDTYCFVSGASSIIFTSFVFTNAFLLLPLCIPILYHGLQNWRQNSSAASMSHSDCFTYHIAIIIITGVFGFIVSYLSFYVKNLSVFVLGNTVFVFTWYGEQFFHILTCLERYLAVVHPVTYLRLKNEKWIRIRNVSVGCVWLLCIALATLFLVKYAVIFDFCFLSLVLAFISFCSVSVLCVLIRPGPGEHGENRKKVDLSKQRAFFTIVTILGALVLRFASNLIWELVYMSTGPTACVITATLFWFNLPSSLVLPLLFLHRKGNNMLKKNNIQAG